MKVSRLYLLGLGSGLILSALLSMMLPPMSTFTGRDHVGGAVPTEKTAPEQKAGAVGTAASADLTSPGTGGTVAASEGNAAPGIPETGKAGLREFTVPSGASAEKIAGLLQLQGFITDKKAFLEVVERKRVASRFQVGTFTLVEKQSAEEIVDALLTLKGH